MRRTIIYLALICLTVPVSYGAFTYHVTDVYYDFQLDLNNQSVLVEGSGVKAINAQGNSYVEVRNTLPLQPHGGIGTVDLWQTSSMKLINGEVGTVYMNNTSSLDVSGGEIDDLFDSTMAPGGTINVTDGYIHTFRVSGSSTSVFAGGQLDSVSFLNLGKGLSVTFICDLNTLNLTYNNGNLVNATGEWLDGSTFDTDFSIGAYDEYVHFVPEPATMLLMAFGGLLIRGKK